LSLVHHLLYIIHGYRYLCQKSLHNYIEIKVHCKIESVMYLDNTGSFLPYFDIGAFFPNTYYT